MALMVPIVRTLRPPEPLSRRSVKSEIADLAPGTRERAGGSAPPAPVWASPATTVQAVNRATDTVPQCIGWVSDEGCRQRTIRAAGRLQNHVSSTVKRDYGAALLVVGHPHLLTSTSGRELRGSRHRQILNSLGGSRAV
jgi:hypothetical protein